MTLVRFTLKVIACARYLCWFIRYTTPLVCKLYRIWGISDPKEMPEAIEAHYPLEFMYLEQRRRELAVKLEQIG